MKATQRDYAQAAQKAAGKLRLYFFCGQDEAGASAAAAKVIASLLDPGERVDLSGSDLRGDPARLVDEARSTSLFGDARHLFVRVSGEEAHDALEAFCDLADRGEADGVDHAVGAADKPSPWLLPACGIAGVRFGETPHEHEASGDPRRTGLRPTPLELAR